MPRVSNSTAIKAESKDGSCKSPKKLPGGSKPVRHRRTVAGCLACRIRGKPCDQQLIVDAYGLPTCKNCSKLNIACIGGFGERKVPNDLWKFWFRLRVKLYMKEIGRVRGIRGWGRSGPNLRKTPLALTEIVGFVDSHSHLSKEEGDHHSDCIFHADGLCKIPDFHLADRSYSQLLMSPSSTESSSDFSQIPSSPMEFPDSPVIPLGHLGESPLFEQSSPEMSIATTIPQYYDATSFSFNAPTQYFPENNYFTIPTVSYTEAYGTGSQDSQVSSSQSSDDTFASQPATTDLAPLDPATIELIMSLLQPDDASLAGFTQGVFDA